MGKKSDAFKKEDYDRLGKNIKYLRKAYRETQEQLALAVGTTKGAISEYESGKRVPTVEILYALSKHYERTMENVITGDFENLFVNCDEYINDVDNIIINYSTLLPIICTESALENKNFSEAYKIHLRVFEQVCSLAPIYDLGNIEKYTALYKKAADEDVIEAHANLLWRPMFHLINLSFNKKSIDPDVLRSKNTTIENLFHKGLLYSIYDEDDTEFEEKREQIIDAYKPDVIEHLYWLKNTHALLYSDLADYYTALGYLFDFFNDDLTKEENRNVGKEMLHVCWLMRNKFAEAYYRVFIHPEYDEE